MLSDVQVDLIITTRLVCEDDDKNPDDFISRFLTVDETDLRYFHAEGKAQSMA